MGGEYHIDYDQLASCISELDGILESYNAITCLIEDNPVCKGNMYYEIRTYLKTLVVAYYDIGELLTKTESYLQSLEQKADQRDEEDAAAFSGGGVD